MAPVPPREQRNPFLRYQGLEYTNADIADFEERLERIYSQEIHQVQVMDFQRMPELTRDGLFARMVMEHRDDVGVVLGRARRRLSWRQFILALGLHTGEEMKSPGFARRFAAGRKSEAHISGGQFVSRLAEHFGLLTAEILQGLMVIAPKLPVCYWLSCERCRSVADDEHGHWVAMGLERQPDATAGALADAEDALAVDEGDQAVLAPIQAP
ncbi:hypothetical protein Tco_0448817 [Tanacetum coccineum]